MSHIKNIFTYFAKFATKTAVLANFVKGKEPGYADFKTSFANHLGVMDFPEYIFGHDKENLLKRISSVKGEFLFVEYNQINNSPGVATRHAFLLTVMVGRKVDTSTIDGMDISLIMDNCLNRLSTLCGHLSSDRKERQTHITINQSRITPYDSVDLAGAVGWSIEMTYEVSGLWD